MSFRFEHVNLSVSDVEGMTRFLTTALPEFRVRGEGVREAGDRWIHVGTDDFYVALFEATTPANGPADAFSGRPAPRRGGEDAAILVYTPR